MLKKQWKKVKKIKGFSLVELIVAIGIFAILASGVVYVFVTSYRNYYGVGDRQVMVQFAQEGMEAVRSIRDNGWQVIVSAADGSNRGVQKINGTWQFSGTSNTLNGFTRVIVVSAVQRNSVGAIVASGGTDDPDTKKVVVTVSGSLVANYVLTTYLTNWSAKTWTQTDWSGVGASEFWASATYASSSYSNISTSTVGQLSLSGIGAVNGSFGAWADLGEDASYQFTGGWPTLNTMEKSPDGDTLYVGGGTNGTGITALDISNVRENKINFLWYMTMNIEVYSMKVHPNGRYMYVGNASTSDGTKIIEVIDLYTQTLVQTINSTDVAASNRIMDIQISANNLKLYADCAYGGLYSFDISADGSTLTLLKPSSQTSLITSAWQQWGTTPHTMWLDESGATPYLYVAGENTSKVISKWDVSSSTVPVQSYTIAGTGNTNDLVYLGNSGSGNTFAIAGEDTAGELKTYRDNGSGFTLLDTFDPGTFSSPGLIYDGSGTVIIYSTTEANMYAVNVSNPADITAVVSDTSTYPATINTWPHHYAKYIAHQGGFFFLSYNSSGYVFKIHFISRPETRSTPSSYSYKRKITIDKTKVQNGPHSNFPILISETQSYLRTVTNGGNVQSDKGYDIIFTDSTMTSILNHEIENYSSSTGEFNAWVQISSLPSASDTDIYMFYGNANATTTPAERVTSVWDSNYQVVNHMNDLTTLNVASTTKLRNSKFNTNDATKYATGAPAQSASKIGYGQTFDGSYDYSTVTNHTDNQQGTSDFTVEFWINPDSTGTTYSCPVYKGNGNAGTAEGWNIRYQQGSSDKLQFMAGSGSVDLGDVFTTNALTENSWTHIALINDRDVGYRFYVNGNPDNSYNVNTSAYSIGTTNNMYFGRDWSTSDYFFKGSLDEIRVSKTLRSADWIKTEYNNMNSTSTFYTIGAATSGAVYNTPGTLMSSIIDLGSSDQVLTSFTVNQNVPTGCALTVTLQGSDDKTFSTYTSNAFTDNSVSTFTSSTPASLNNLRYFRYSTALTACSNNSVTPTLYSVKLNFR